MKRLPTVRLPPKRRQTGFLMAQAAVVVAILSLASAYYGNRYWQATLNQERDDKAKLIGERMANVSDATKTYATTFFTQIQRGEAVTRNGYSLATQRLFAPTLADLSGLGFLPTTATNPVIYNGQSIQFNVAMRVNTQSGCTIPTCSLLFQVTTSAPLLIPNGNTVDIRRATIAATAASPGNAGVSMPSSMGGDPSVFVGSGGTVTGINTGGVAGLVSISNGYDSQGFFEFLRRDGSLPMTGSLNMQDSSGVKHDILNAGDVSTVNLTASKGVTGETVSSTSRLKTNEFLQINGIAVEGQPCEARTVGLDASGLTLTCTAGRWRSPVTISSPYTAYIPINSPAQNQIVPMGIHKICLLSGVQATGEGADHCVISGYPGSNWELSARTTRDTITDHWCIATCID
ncbi:hypothetical protein [Pseudomonas viridiflava]|uniref:hypothetical protein n=1 Tax=Pseudomonas viridiflava TaxID=33069 RepID=UPI0013DD7F03|nr:hypothetical protein [Pseudomonas viridiflava]